jgi:uncharacterized protein (TIRG00374 family)
MSVLQKTDRQKGSLNYLIKLAITGGLLLLIIRSIDTREAALALSAVSPASMLAALLLQIASTLTASIRWYLIMTRIGFDQPIGFFLKSYFKGTFFNQGLPTSIGGDGLRILDCSRAREKGGAEDAFYGVFIDRIIGLAGLLLLNIGALAFNRDLLPANVYYPLLVILSGLSFGLVLLFFLRKFRFIVAGKYLGFLGRLSERYFQVYSTPGSIAVQLGLSLLTHMLAMFSFFMIGNTVGLNLPIEVYLVLVPPVILLTILPISLAGWGVREGAMVGFFLLIGADRTKVLTFSILYGLVALVASVPGLFVFLTRKNKLS